MNSQSTNRDLASRTLQFASDVIRFCSSLPRTPEIDLIKRQLLRAATSVGVNYRSARRAKSRRDFVAKLAIIEEEADKCLYWMDLLGEVTRDAYRGPLMKLIQEAGEPVSIIVASKKTARGRGI